jgi:hypothetical protein
LDYSTRSALVLLTGFQTPDAIRSKGHKALVSYLHRHGAWPAALITRLAAHLLDLDQQIKDTDKMIAPIPGT